MDKRKTLELCEKGWLELAATGAAVKPKMFAKFDNECPCCEYDLVTGHDTCGHCPISWPGAHCNDSDSPFFMWSYAQTPAIRKKHAAQVAALARAELDKP